MPRRPATITQADVARAVRAAMQAGAGKVEVRPDGTIMIHLGKSEDEHAPLERRREIVL